MSLGRNLADTGVSLPRCFGMGFVAMDVVEGLDETFAAPGGSCGNVMALLSWLGWDAYPIARLGSDEPGVYVRHELSLCGVRTDFLTNELSVKTPVVIQRFVEDGEGQRIHRYALTCPDCGGWLPRFRPVTIRQATVSMEAGIVPEAIFLDRLSPSALKLAAWGRERGSLVLFEPSSVGDEGQFQKAIEICHVLKFAKDRLGHVPDIRNLIGPDLVIQTLGAEGLEFRLNSSWYDLSAYEAPVFVDAAGSGDWCTAMFLDGWYRAPQREIGLWLPDEVANVLAKGQAAAAINCGFEGARGAMMAIDHELFEPLLNDLLDGRQISLRSLLPGAARSNVSLCQACEAQPVSFTALGSRQKQSD